MSRCIFTPFPTRSTGLEMSTEAMARQLSVSEQKIMDAWDYWEKMGVIRKRYLTEGGQRDFAVEFINLKELLYGKHKGPAKGERKRQKKDNVFGNKAVKAMFSSTEQSPGKGTELLRADPYPVLAFRLRATPEVV